ncbi:GntR family transcriptional regulator [Roseibium sp.]|uniref:GntR family transcriptional regulator n=1 Tax=Roseibium sp. TaxID=1936156 RepID=UPI003A983875
MKSYADSEPVLEAIESFEGTAKSKGNQTTSDKRVLTALRRLIMDGSIPSGAKITEVGLSSLLKISRTPIRLALKTLEVEGLIQKRDGRGYTVCDLDFDDLSKAYEVRGVLEGLAARRLAMSGLAQDVEIKLRRSLQMTGEAVRLIGAHDDCGVDMYQEANTLFHETILNACDNTFVPFTLTRLENLPLLKPGTLVFNSENFDMEFQRLTIGHGQHLIVFDAITKRDPARAEAMMREHSYATVNYSMLFSK